MSDQTGHGTTFTWRDVRDIALLLPALHLAFCFIFLTFYSLGYGRAIEVFYAPSDVFHVSFRDIAPGYVALATMALIAFIFRNSLTNVGTATSQNDGRTLSLRQRIILFTMAAAAYAMAVVSIIGALLYYRLTGRIAFSAVVSLTIAFIVLYCRFLHLKNLERLQPMVALAFLFPVLVSAYSGAQSAERDEFLTYTSLDKDSPRCGNFAMIRNIGDYFMAAAKDGQRVMIDEDCKPRFILPPPRFAR